MTPFSGVISQLPCGLLITLDGFYYGKGNTFFLIKQAFRLWIYNPSAKTIISRYKECLIHYHGIPHSSDSVKELTSQQMRYSRWPMFMEVIGFTMFPITLK